MQEIGTFKCVCGQEVGIPPRNGKAQRIIGCRECGTKFDLRYSATGGLPEIVLCINRSAIFPAEPMPVIS